jgi:hypothetical protein
MSTADQAPEPAKWLKHPHDPAEYGAIEGERVVVRDLESGKSGVFDAAGHWVCGELRWADNHMIRWAIDAAVQTQAIAPSAQ